MSVCSLNAKLHDPTHNDQKVPRRESFARPGRWRIAFRDPLGKDCTWHAVGMLHATLTSRLYLVRVHVCMHGAMHRARSMPLAVVTCPMHVHVQAVPCTVHVRVCLRADMPRACCMPPAGPLCTWHAVDMLPATLAPTLAWRHAIPFGMPRWHATLHTSACCMTA
jgi:hypothetical protein